MKPVILTFVGCYLPGYKAGGPIQTIANMVERLGDEFEFRIITSDRDLGEKEPYSSVGINKFNKVGKAKVFYASREMTSFGNLSKLINQIPHDILYLNSFFDPRFTIRPLILRRMDKLPNAPVIVAPRGEFSQGALKLKWQKKHAYIVFAKAIGLYKNIIWQASSEYEERDIRKWFGDSDIVHIAPDLTPATGEASRELFQNRRKKEKGFLKIVFLSRISPKKNLDGALRILEKVKGRIEMNIYGPITDEAYWTKCREIVDRMPENVNVSYKGNLPHEEVPRVMSEHDLLFFPTHGENFGHVIFEALSVGTPVLISDQTPWRNLKKQKAGWEYRLEDQESFLQAIEQGYPATFEEYQLFNSGAHELASRFLEFNKVVEANHKLFRKVILTKL